jgi:hypothetical protein
MFDEDGYDEFIPEEIRPWLESRLNSLRDGYYVFVNGKIRKASLHEWGRWFGNLDNRRIDYTEISNEPNYPGGSHVSTVCLGLDHNIGGPKPILFETMVFGGEWDQSGWRYSSYSEAKQGHWMIVDCIREGNRPTVPFGERPWFELFMEMFEDENENEDQDHDDV